MALRPDDVLENILIQFLKNLKPALRNLSYVTPYLPTFEQDLLLRVAVGREIRNVALYTILTG